MARGGSTVLVGLGAALLVASLFQPASSEFYAVGLLVFGSGLVVLGVVLPRLQKAEVSPATGLKLSLAEEREVSTELAESGAVGQVGAAQVVAATRLIVASEALARLLAPDSGPLAGVPLHLYLFDEQRRLLLPAFEGRPSASRGWKLGTGAVGEAWASGEYVLVKGPAVSDETYGLTPAQQRRFRDLAVVAAMPVSNASDEVIAVLTGSSVDPDTPLATAEGFDAQLLLAQQVARVLVDLLRWFPD
ncbi:MAG: hypothetical protein M3203_00935 [Actinomycetota bacterium]|nr:hypothetical protein [Actinomycetota bacterium]